MKQQILGSDFAKLGIDSEEEMTLVKANPGNQYTLAFPMHSCYGSLTLFVFIAG